MGNLDAKRIGHAKDYVEMQWLMLQQEKPDDFVIASGRMETVRNFIELSAKKLNWGTSYKPPIIWEGTGLDEVGIRSDTNKVVVKIDKRYFRPTEVEQLLGDSSKAFKKLGWVPKISLEELVEEMIEYDKEEVLKENF